MQIFLHDQNTSPKEAVRQALDVLPKAGTYSTEGDGTTILM
jgi:hypothetical protein